MIYLYGLLIIVSGISLTTIEGPLAFIAGIALAVIGAVFIGAATYLGGKVFGPPNPLLEARIYLVFGQKTQALELLEKALLKNPERTEIAAKLSELRNR
jgi:hypothetical protein